MTMLDMIKWHPISSTKILGKFAQGKIQTITTYYWYLFKLIHSTFENTLDFFSSKFTHIRVSTK